MKRVSGNQKSRRLLGRTMKLVFSLVSWCLQLAFKPDLVMERVEVSVPSLAHGPTKQLKIVQLTDIHYDPSCWVRTYSSSSQKSQEG